MFVAYLIDKGMQSATVKSYVSAIKKMLLLDGYKWKDELVYLNSLTKACKLINDWVRPQFLISNSLLDLLLFKVQRKFNQQIYLQILYKALFTLGYYGLLRVGELTNSPHTIKAKDVHVGTNKDKVLIVLYSSKTHDRSMRPQKVKITSNKYNPVMRKQNIRRNFDPFEILADYISAHGGYASLDENFFIFKGKIPVEAVAARKLLKELIAALGLNADLYDMHSLRIGRATDLIKYTYSIDEVKRLGRWRSNIVYKYVRF